jgi:hypothetical protein
MSGAAKAYQWLVWIILACVGVQFFLAGLGTLGGESIDPHEGFGSLIQLLTLILAILAVVSRQSSEVKGMTFALLVLAILQSVFAMEDLDQLRAFHVFDAFLIAGLTNHLCQKVGFPLKTATA